MTLFEKYIRFSTLALVTLLALLSLILAATWSAWMLIPALIFAGLALVGVKDIFQTSHSILRNYPVLGHLRFMFEDVRPELRQYFFESDKDEEPFSRETRSLVYQRAKGIEDKRPFGTTESVYQPGYSWLTHSIVPNVITDSDFRVRVGGPDCTQPYDVSLLNISAMSFGALSANAILALNAGAKKGGFAHDTGEGGISRYHRQEGGDLVYQVASGYFGCRTPEGQFCPERFAEQAKDPQIKMIELKLSQGAKPGHGGMLPAAKISHEIAEARGIPMGVDCISPARHSTFSTPIELMEFIARLRELAQGKPVGFKLCIGHRREFMCIVKAMLETGVTPDFIIVDGKEGGTGSAPLEFANRVGMPMLEGLHFVHNTLRGAGLRDKIKICAAGKITSAYHMARALALGADWCNSARGFMFAVGCIQAQHCHTNNCPVGVATQDERRQRALVVPDKAERVYNFHHNTIAALAEFVAAAGLDHPRELRPEFVYLREGNRSILPASKALRWLKPGELLETGGGDGFADYWAMASAETFAPKRPAKLAS